MERITVIISEHETKDFAAIADDYIIWAAGRAAAITMFPLPIADIGALMANEAYMIYRIAETYGYDIDSSIVSMLIASVGGTFMRRLLFSLLPILKIPVVAGITYAMGKVAKVYFASGMTMSREALRIEFTKARRKASRIDWYSKESIDVQEGIVL
ncbi:MAG: DUF697 domain-containing protein [Victivallales bacterium]|nr:DUF697 domain-containing protein [Victivallales bacterium]